MLRTHLSRSSKVVVVGGGPGGSTAARELARRNHEVLLIESRPSPEKPCGGGLTQPAWSSVEPHVEGIPKRVVRHVTLRDPFGAVTGVELDSPLTIVARHDLDRRLCEAASRAGAVVVSDRVVRVLATARGFRVETERATYDADYLVGADGAKSLVRKSLQAERRIAQSTPLDLFSVSLTSYPAVDLDRIDLKFFSDLNGYAWLFPRLDHVSAGICATASTRSAALRDALAAYLEEALGVTGETVIGALIPSFDRTVLSTITIEGQYYALVGDAAGAVDPLTREGIRFAVRTGELVGELDAPRNPGAYQRAYRRELMPELALAARLTRTFFSPRFLTRFVRCVRRSPQVAHVFSDLVAGVQPYRTLMRRLLILSPLIAMDYLRTWRSAS